jgi:hypothetical protein
MGPAPPHPAQRLPPIPMSPGPSQPQRSGRSLSAGQHSSHLPPPHEGAHRGPLLGEPPPAPPYEPRSPDGSSKQRVHWGALHEPQQSQPQAPPASPSGPGPLGAGTGAGLGPGRAAPHAGSAGGARAGQGLGAQQLSGAGLSGSGRQSMRVWEGGAPLGSSHGGGDAASTTTTMAAMRASIMVRPGRGVRLERGLPVGWRWGQFFCLGLCQGLTFSIFSSQLLFGVLVYVSSPVAFLSRYLWNE